MSYIEKKSFCESEGEFVSACTNDLNIDIIRETLAISNRYVNASDMRGLSPLICAIKFKCKKIFEILLENGAKVDELEEDGTTPLFSCIMYHRFDFARILIAKGADPAKTLTGGNFPLLAAVRSRKKSYDAVKMLLEEGANPNQFWKQTGYFPLGEAVSFGNSRICNLLLDNGANPNQIDVVDGFHPLEIAAVRGRLDCVKSLLTPRYRKKEVLWCCLVREYVADSIFNDDYLCRDMFFVIMATLSTRADPKTVNPKSGKTVLELLENHGDSDVYKEIAKLMK